MFDKVNDKAIKKPMAKAQDPRSGKKPFDASGPPQRRGQVPDKNREIESSQGGREDKSPQKTMAELKKEKYIKLLEQDDVAYELADKERFKAINCMTKVMKHQLDTIGVHFEDLKEDDKRFHAEMNEFDKQQNSAELKIFSDYHQARLRRMKYEIEAGLHPDYGVPDEEEELAGLSPEELEAHAELQAYAETL